MRRGTYVAGRDVTTRGNWRLEVLYDASAVYLCRRYYWRGIRLPWIVWQWFT